jgi:hypothetical protein
VSDDIERVDVKAEKYLEHEKSGDFLSTRSDIAEKLYCLCCKNYIMIVLESPAQPIYFIRD